MNKPTSIFATSLSVLVIACAIAAISPLPAVAQTAGNVDCKGCVGSKDIQNKSVKKNDLKKNAVTGAKVKNSSLKGADIATQSIPAGDLSNGAGGDFDVNATTNTEIIPLTVSEVVYRTVTLTAPSAGQVILNATGLVSGTAAGTFSAFCSISKDATLDGRTLTAVQFVSPPVNVAPFGITWGESIAAAGTQTWNLVCAALVAGSTLANPALTAIFVPTRY